MKRGWTFKIQKTLKGIDNNYGIGYWVLVKLRSAIVFSGLILTCWMQLHPTMHQMWHAMDNHGHAKSHQHAEDHSQASTDAIQLSSAIRAHNCPFCLLMPAAHQIPIQPESAAYAGQLDCIANSFYSCSFVNLKIGLQPVRGPPAHIS